MNQKLNPQLARQPLAVYASYVHSAWELSNGLRALRVSHTVQPPERDAKRRRIDLGFPQPRHVHIASELKDLRLGAINFIVVSHSELSLTNIPLVPCGPEWNLDQGLRRCLQNPAETLVQIKAPTAVDYINMIAKPSLLNKVQTEILRISPYQWRKEVQAEVVKFFNGRISERTLLRFLSKSLKLDHLKSLIKQGGPLRDAIAMLDTMDAEAISQKTGVPAFDISYFASAARKLDEPKPKPTTKTRKKVEK